MLRWIATVWQWLTWWHWRRFYTVRRFNITELSIVPVPSDPRAVIDREPCWEVVAAYDDDTLCGYRVRWSEPDEQGRYLWVRHYLTDFRPEDPSLGWCELAAERDAQRMNEQGRHPAEWERG